MKIKTFLLTKNRGRRFKTLQFIGKDEFDVSIVHCPGYENSSVFWNTLQSIFKESAKRDDRFILVCSDSHIFLPGYSSDILMNCINDVKNQNVDVLLGGVSWFKDAVKFNRHIYWISKFSGIQFAVFFKPFFDIELNKNENDDISIEGRISSLSTNIFCIFPFISAQRGCCKMRNPNSNTFRNVPYKSIFRKSVETLRKLQKVQSLLTVRSHSVSSSKIDAKAVYSSLPTYVINLPERLDRRNHIIRQFQDRPEFVVRLIEACRHRIGSLGLWLSIRRVVEMGLQCNHDVMLICEDDHVFTEAYSSATLLKHISIAKRYECEYLSGGTGKFEFALPITENLFWTNFCLSTQFIILFKRCFNKILDEPYGEDIVSDIKLSAILTRKMLLYPFISTQRDFGYSDVTSHHTAKKGFVEDLFTMSSNRLDFMYKAIIKHNIQLNQG